MKELLEFTSISKHYITGRGEVIVVKSKSDKNLVAETVKIDGCEYKVNGVEVQGYLEKDKNIGLLVRKPT